MSIQKDIKVTSFGDRLRLSIGKNVTQQQLADDLKVSTGAIKKWLTNKSQPNINKIEDIAKILNKDIKWLITGENEELETKVPSSNKIPVYDAQFSAGDGCFNSDDNIIAEYPFPDSFFHHYGLSKLFSLGVLVRGDSMEPKFHDGDIAIVDRRINEYEHDGIYAFSYDGHCYIKHLQMLGSELYAVSANKAYEKWIIDGRKEIRIAGIVKAVLGRV